MARIRLVVRGDDAGSCASADRAVRECCERGIVHNVSVMIPGPTFAAAVDLLRELPNICLGLHVTLNAEWDAVKWGPVLPPNQVPSLVDENGHFLPTPRHLYERGASVDEMMAEVEAQLARAQAYGLPIAYVDQHMGVGWVAGVGERLRSLCERAGLVDAANVPGLPMAGEAGGDLVSRWLDAVRRAAPGTYVLVTHPGLDAPDMRAFGGSVAQERDAERQALISPRLRDALTAADVELIRYDQAEDRPSQEQIL